MNTRDLREHLAAGGAALFDLSSRLKFRLTGADRVRYLNGQVSNDVRKLAAAGGGETGTETRTAFPACIMTAKGKMNALVWVCAGVDALQLDADAPGNAAADAPEGEALREALAARLERYIISDDVEVTDTTDSLRLLHLLGVPGEGEAAMGLFSSDAAGVELFRSRRFGVEGIDLLGSPGAIAAVVLPANMLKVDAVTAETFRIEQGIPRWGAELDENTIPVEAGLDADAIDYHKGCYIGQEVISRIKSIGRVNRHLHGFIADKPLTPGARLFTGGAQEKEAGVITSAAWSFALDKAVALGYLKRDIDATRLRAGSVEVEVRPLPNPFPVSLPIFK